MTKEELIGKLHMIYAGDRNALEEMVGYYDGLKEVVEIVQQENKELKEQLLVTQTNEETFRLEMKDITQTLGLDEDTIFDDVKAFVRSLEVENQKYKEVIDKAIEYLEQPYRDNFDYSKSQILEILKGEDNV